MLKKFSTADAYRLNIVFENDYHWNVFSKFFSEISAWKFRKLCEKVKPVAGIHQDSCDPSKSNSVLSTEIIDILERLTEHWPVLPAQAAGSNCVSGHCKKWRHMLYQIKNQNKNICLA